MFCFVLLVDKLAPEGITKEQVEKYVLFAGRKKYDGKNIIVNNVSKRAINCLNKVEDGDEEIIDEFKKMSK